MNGYEGLQYVKYNLLKRTIIKILIYALFRQKYEWVDEVLQYNQPNDSRSLRGNNEIVPTNTIELLELIESTYVIEQELRAYWSGHSDVGPYIDQMTIILFKNLVLRERRGINREDNQGEIYINKLSSSELAGLKSYLETISAMIAKSVNSNSLFNKHYFSKENKTSNEEVIESIQVKIKTLLKNIAEAFKIAEETVPIHNSNLIAQNIIDNYHLNKSLLTANFIHLNSSDHQNVDLLMLPVVRINQLFDKTQFIPDWHIPTYGLSESCGRRLQLEENQIIMSAIASSIRQESGEELILEREILNKLRAIDLTDKIIIGANVFFDSIFREEQAYTPRWELPEEMQKTLPSYYFGTYKQADIYSIQDQISSCILIVSKYIKTNIEIINLPWATEYEQYKEFKYKVIVFSQEQENLDKFLANSPDWLEETAKLQSLTPKEYMKKKVLVSIVKAFRVGRNSDPCEQFYIIRK